MSLLSDVDRPCIFWILLIETCFMTCSQDAWRQTCSMGKTESGVNHILLYRRHIPPGQGSPEGLRCSLHLCEYCSSPCTFTSCNTDNYNIWSIFIFTRQRALWKVQSHPKPYSHMHVLWVEIWAAINSLSYIAQMRKQNIICTVSIVECAYSI